MPGTPDTCLLDRAPTPAAVGRLCEGHLQAVASLLFDIEDQAAELDPVPSCQQTDGSRGATLASHRAPARLNVLVHRDPRIGTGWAEDDDTAHAAGRTLSVLGTLTRYADRARTEQRITPDPEWTITTERRLLTAQLPHIAGQPWVRQLHRDLVRLHAQLLHINHLAEPKAKHVGICPTLIGATECGGRLWLDEAEGGVYCDRCPRLFGDRELRHLGTMLLAQGYVQADRAAWYTGVPVGTIRRWVAEGRITSAKAGRKLTVQVTEVEQLRDRRRRRATGLVA